MELITTKICKTSDIGVNDNLFGGVMLSWLDEAGAAYVAKKIHDKKVVTMKMDEVMFKKPVKVGDIIEVKGEIIQKGVSSVIIHVSAWRVNVSESVHSVKHTELVCSTEMVFVRIDSDGHKKAIDWS